MAKKKKQAENQKASSTTKTKQGKPQQETATSLKFWNRVESKNNEDSPFPGNSRFTAGAFRCVYDGVEDLRALMPDLTDEQIWSVINYARATFGNSGQ